MSRLIRIKEIMWAGAMFGLVAIIARLFQGLGAVSALSDALPWGLWKIGNMVAGVCLGTCGFTISAGYYVFKIQKLEKLVKPAVLIAFLGYGASAFSLMLDIGLPWRIWQPMIYWNIHSFLFEVAMCVMFYFSVCTFEMMPIVTEAKWHNFAHTLHKISFPIILLGITLSSMHHTSLGSLFLVDPTRMHPVWFSEWIWGIFISSSIGSGLLCIVFMTLAFGWLYNRDVDMNLLQKVAGAGLCFTSIYAIMKSIDLARTGQWGNVLTVASWEYAVFIVQSIILVIIPITLFLIGRVRRTKNGLALLCFSGMVGIVMHRIDAGIVAFFRSSGSFYFPTLPEWFISIGVYCAAGLVFLFVIENFEVFEHPPVRPKEGKGLDDKMPFDPASGVWQGALMNPAYRYSGVAVISLVLAVGVFSSSLLNGTTLKSEKVQPVTAEAETRAVLIINGNENDVAVKFKHDWHKENLGGDESCRKCHHLDMPEDKDTACWKCHRNMELKTPIFSHQSHIDQMGGNKACDKCHPDGNKPESRDNTRQCIECHEEDMRMAATDGITPYDYNAPSYVDAMHRSCIECHLQMQDEVDRPTLEECYTCHEDVKLLTVMTSLKHRGN